MGPRSGRQHSLSDQDEMQTFRSYIRRMVQIVLSSSLILGVIVGVSLLVFGEGTLDLNLDLDFGAMDGLWVILGLPIIAVITFVILSPFSFYVYKRLAKRDENEM